MLTLSMGKGYYSYSRHHHAPDVWTDASRRVSGAHGPSYSGGGYLSACGRYSYFIFSSEMVREWPIDYLEGCTILVAVRQLSRLWRKCRVTIWIDNSAFQQSGAAGRSKVERLNVLLRRLLVLQVEYEFILEYKWISSEDNYLADHLSRGRLQEFLEAVEDSGQLQGGAILQPEGEPGEYVYDLLAMGGAQ